MRRTALSCLAAFVLATAAPPPAVRAQGPSEPEKNFEYLWSTFDRNYALFAPKSVDWDALYRVYRPRVTPRTTDDELFDVMASLLGHLNDNHVRLFSPTRTFQSGILGQIKMEDFSLDLVKRKYLGGRSKQAVDGVFTYGWLDGGVGYFQFRGFGRLEASAAAIDEIVREFKDAKAVIVDVRGNGGGDDRVGKAIADRFADRKRLYMKTRIRDGAARDAFTAPKYWYVEPAGPAQFTRPVALLTHRHSVSAAENFALAMRVLPHVTVVGDATSGVFADVYADRLPNGWRFSVSYKLFEDQNGFCWEGIGVPADLRQTNSKQDVEQQRDRVLEFAAALVTTGAPAPSADASSLRDLRESYGEALAGVADKGGDVASAARDLLERRDAYYVDEDELLELGDRLFSAGKRREATEVFSVMAREFPHYYVPHEKLGELYAEAGETARSREAYAKAMELNRRSYPWEVTAYEDAKRALAGVKLLSKALARDMGAKGVEEALRAFERGRAGGPGTYHVDEGEVNQLGYDLLGAGKALEAVEVFKLNVREYPKSSNAYDSLGEAYLAAGQKERAIENYRKSLELDPSNANAVQVLERLGAKPAAP